MVPLIVGILNQGQALDDPHIDSEPSTPDRTRVCRLFFISLYLRINAQITACQGNRKLHKEWEKSPTPVLNALPPIESCAASTPNGFKARY